MNSSDLTPSQVEHSLSQQIKELYSQWLGSHQSHVTCHLSGKMLTILIENCISPTERLMLESGNFDGALRWRSKLENVLQPRLRSQIEAELKISVLDLLKDTSLTTNRTGFIVVLESVPTCLAESI